MPGQITSRNSDGTNGLIKQGAKVVLGADDIIEELAPVLRGFIRKSDCRPPAEISEEEGRICGFLTQGAQTYRSAFEGERTAGPHDA